VHSEMIVSKSRDPPEGGEKARPAPPQDPPHIYNGPFGLE
jgi:hypothetical protein